MHQKYIKLQKQQCLNIYFPSLCVAELQFLDSNLKLKPYSGWI